MPIIIRATDGQATHWALSLTATTPNGETRIYPLLINASSEMEAKGMATTRFLEKFPGSGVHAILAIGLAVADEQAQTPASTT